MARGYRSTAVMLATREEWGVSESTAWRLISAVRDRWARESEVGRPQARAEILAQADELLTSAYESGDLPQVAKALGLKAEMHGLKLRSVVVTDASGALTPEERAALAAGLDGAGGPRDGD